MLKQELIETDDETTIKLVGRITFKEVQLLKAQVTEGRARVVLDLEQVELVDLDAARFLATAELCGVELRRVPRYVREWIVLEKPRVAKHEMSTLNNRNE